MVHGNPIVGKKAMDGAVKRAVIIKQPTWDSSRNIMVTRSAHKHQKINNVNIYPKYVSRRIQVLLTVDFV